MVGINYMGYFVCEKATEKLRNVDNWGTVLSVDIELQLRRQCEFRYK